MHQRWSAIYVSCWCGFLRRGEFYGIVHAYWGEGGIACLVPGSVSFGDGVRWELLHWIVHGIGDPWKALS